MVYLTKKGSILIAVIFIIVLSITAVSFFAMIGGRTTLTVNQLKRTQAVNCAEAALYETFNRIRAGATPASLNGITIQVPVANPDPPPATYDVAVDITVIVIGVVPNIIYKISAAVNYDDIRM